MKFLIQLCFLYIFITLEWVETNTSAGLRKHHVEKLQNQVSVNEKTQNVVHSDKRTVRRFTRGRNKEGGQRDSDVNSWKTDRNKSHPQTINDGKGIPCEGTSCLWSSKNVATSKISLRNKLTRKRRTESVFLAKALDSLDHSKPRELSNFATRATPNKPYKQFSNGTDISEHSSNSTTDLKNKPVKNQAGDKRHEWSDVKSEMKPRFFFNSAPAEYVEQKTPSVHRPNDAAVHLRQGPFHAPGHLHGIGPGRFFHVGKNHLHIVKHLGRLLPFPIHLVGHPPPHHIPVPLNIPNHHSHLHHFAPPPPYAIHIHAPPRLGPPAQPNIIPQQLPPINVPPSIPPDMLGGQIPAINPSPGGEFPSTDVHMMPPPDGPIHNHPPIDAPVTPEINYPDFTMMPPTDIPVAPHAVDIQGMPPPVDISPMAPQPSVEKAPLPEPVPDMPISPHPIDIQGMPLPGDITPMESPPAVEKVPFPVLVPSPPKVEHVPYPVPVPGPPSVQPVVVPVGVPSPPNIQEIAVPVPSPPKIKNVPVPYPVEVPSPPQIQRVAYPVAVPVKEAPEIQKIFYPIAVSQPSQVHNVPYPIYIRYPPEIRRVPFPVPSPPKPYPVPVPSPPQLMIHRVPYPVMYPHKVPFPVPVEVHHHHIHEEVDNGGGNYSFII